MKKSLFITLFAIFAMVASSVCFVSCSDDDKNSSSNELVGKWDVESSDSGDGVITFNSNGTFTFRVEDYYETYTVSGNYSFDGSTLTITYEENDGSGRYRVNGTGPVTFNKDYYGETAGTWRARFTDSDGDSWSETWYFSKY